jgi:hypothetical protein
MLKKALLLAALFLAFVAVAREDSGERAWWQRPGLGIQFQIEQRPGWVWERNFVKFNKAMMDERGGLNFDGPFCKVSEFLDLSRRAGVDYHLLEVKWHDGICYFNTKLTDWKTPEDYAGEFAEQSRAAGIPFMFYYSTIFDHNPMFDRIQPNRFSTVSLIGTVPGHVYTEYLAGQYRELIEQYHPDGLWLDWYTVWPDQSTSFSVKFLREHYPGLVVTFNASNDFAAARRDLSYTSGEAHGLNRTRIEFDSLTNLVGSFSGNAWKMANRYRREFTGPWELISPCGRNWQDVRLRADLMMLTRMSAVVMANGGRSLIGVGTELSGSVIPDHVKQMECVGEWYKPRKALFNEAVALKYAGDRPPGVSGYSDDFGAVAVKIGDDKALHLINFTGSPGPVTLELSGEPWQSAKKVFLEPMRQELEFDGGSITLSGEQVDQVDTILRFDCDDQEKENF